ncbi:Alginate export [Microbulbifer donghaiensis]|uniref:Alginate export n=1 Tax=Microbulbifer donghaiensis TaxID=494016 RepID=A0A1M4UVL3_9GAMM|nr:alginate export family protein [Microbulbifer donghaiensis]SHE60709.1 Alginate export [Microbulbifer donghaiensis]
MRYETTAIAAIALLIGEPGIAQEGEPPAIEKLRFDEDYSYLRTVPRPYSWPDCWKYIPFDDDPDRYLTIGGEVRQRYEYTNNPTYGQDPQDKRGVLLQRYSLFGDLHWNRHLRFFGQLTSALEAGRAEGSSPVDEDKLEWQNAFVDLSPGGRDGREATLRLGRQEIVLGSGRLVDVREGPNVRRTFDGGRGFVIGEGWRVDVVAARPRLDRRGVFDDKTNNTQALWGIYSVFQKPLPPFGNLRGNLDLYYLGYENEDSTYVQGTEHEDRHSFGARYWGDAGNWSWNWETLYQFGRFGSGDINAWTLATETTHRWADIHWQPAVKISINIASGDDDLDDSDLGTFNPLYPRGNYFSEAAVFGPRNFYNFHTFLYLQPIEALALTVDLNFFWRLETEDGLYSPAGQIIRGPDDSDAHFAATALSLTAEYTFCRGLVFTAIHTFGKPEKFLRETAPSEDLGFTELTLQYRF